MRITDLFSAGPAVAAAGILGLLILAAPAGATAADSAELLPSGQPAPDFEAVDIDGKPFVMKEALAGGPIFLVFWSIF